LRQPLLPSDKWPFIRGERRLPYFPGAQPFRCGWQVIQRAVQHESFAACSPRVRGLAVTAHGARTSAPVTVKSAYAAAKPEARGGGARVQGDIEPWRISVYGYYDHRTMRRIDAA
jgi:hypothetical protein